MKLPYKTIKIKIALQTKIQNKPYKACKTLLQQKIQTQK